MSVLRFYEPGECDEAGVPLDWSECRTCAGTGLARAREFARLDTPHGSAYLLPTDAGAALREPCAMCDGHGSLRAAALAVVARGWVWADGTRWDPESGAYVHAGEPEVRCADCGHPMSDGTWRPEGSTRQPPTEREASATLSEVLDLLHTAHRLVTEFGADDPPEGRPEMYWTHWSACDKGCRHDVARRRRQGPRGPARRREVGAPDPARAGLPGRRLGADPRGRPVAELPVSGFSRSAGPPPLPPDHPVMEIRTRVVSHGFGRDARYLLTPSGARQHDAAAIREGMAEFFEGLAKDAREGVYDDVIDRALTIHREEP